MFSNFSDSVLIGHGFEKKVCRVLEHVFKVHRWDEEGHGPLLDATTGKEAERTSAQAFYWHVRHECRRCYQGSASREDLFQLWKSCSITCKWKFTPKNIEWFTTWEAWQHDMNLREVDCILYPKNEVDFTSLPDAFLRSREEQPITWQQLVQLVPSKGAYCEVTVPSWAEAQPWKTKVDKTEKIIWLHGLASKSGMSVVLLFNGSSPQNPPVEQEHLEKCEAIHFPQEVIDRWEVAKEASRADKEASRADRAETEANRAKKKADRAKTEASRAKKQIRKLKRKCRKLASTKNKKAKPLRRLRTLRICS